MYITIEKNSRGKLEIEEKAVNKLVEYAVRTNVQGLTDVLTSNIFLNDNSIYITVRMFVKERADLSINEEHLNNVIHELTFQTLQMKPKNVFFAYERA